MGLKYQIERTVAEQRAVKENKQQEREALAGKVYQHYLPLHNEKMQGAGRTNIILVRQPSSCWIKIIFRSASWFNLFDEDQTISIETLDDGYLVYSNYTSNVDHDSFHGGKKLMTPKELHKYVEQAIAYVLLQYS